MIDYKYLLMKYMEHVGDVEGISFIPYNDPNFSREEISELKKIEDEIDELAGLSQRNF